MLRFDVQIVQIESRQNIGHLFFGAGGLQKKQAKCSPAFQYESYEVDVC